MFTAKSHGRAGRGGGWIALASVGLVGVGLSGCRGVDKDPGDPSAVHGVTSALKIKAPIPEGDDVKSIRFQVQPVACDSGAPSGAPSIEVRPIEDQKVPGGVANLQNSPLDKDSAHAFADLFQVVQPGCYDITTDPLGDGDVPSKDCASASKKGVVVKPAETTEIFLINQCKGADKGAIDVISALNHPPVLLDARFTDSKFTCGSAAQFCASARDVDGDPLELTLEILSGNCEVVAAAAAGAPMVSVDQCFTVTCHDAGKAELRLSVYDQLWTNGSQQHIEDWLAAQGSPGDSHARLDYPAYFDGTKVYPDADGDGHGDTTAAATLVCGALPPGTSTINDDCNDADASVNPDAAEVCGDAVDNNCDGQINEKCNQCDHGLTCGEFHGDSCKCNGPFGSDCGKTPEGDPVCFAHFFCDQNPSCTTSAECPDGRRCVIETCCGGGRCAPNTCDGPPALGPRAFSPVKGAADGQGPRSDGT